MSDGMRMIGSAPAEAVRIAIDDMMNDPISAQAVRPTARRNRSYDHQTRGGGGSGGDVGQCIIANGSALTIARKGFDKPMSPAKTAAVEPAHFAAQNNGGHFAAPLQQAQSSCSADVICSSGVCASFIICSWSHLTMCARAKPAATGDSVRPNASQMAKMVRTTRMVPWYPSTRTRSTHVVV